MGVSRISSTYMVDRGVFNLQQNLLLMNKLQEQVASGKKISNPSDDPVGLTQLLRLDTEIEETERYKNNIANGLSELAVSDTALTSMVNIATRARELAIQASNNSSGPSQLNAISTEVESLINQLVQLGNTTIAGRHIFAGFKTDISPFTQVGSDVTYNGSQSLLGEPFEREIQIGKNTFLPVNLAGDQILGQVQMVAGVPVGQGLIYSLTKLKTDIDNTVLGTANYNDIRTNIDLIKADQQSILTTQTTLGSRVNQLELTASRYEDRNVIQTQEIAKIQDIDMAKAISDLNFQQTIFQSSLSVMGRIMQSSLVNFLS